MRKRWLAVLGLMAALGLVTPTLMAENGKGKGNPHANLSFDDDDQGRQGDRDDRWERRGGYEYRTYGEGGGRSSNDDLVLAASQPIAQSKIGPLAFTSFLS
jgi:hypothetical protein